jgi:NADH-quinone oxidoreductase subunit L
MTHAFFKALLFLGAGSVIIAMHHEQDIRQMGGLRRYLPITYTTMLLGSLALIGFPFFSGFYSKDTIIEAVHLSKLPAANIAYWAVLLSVFVTALYSFRLFFLVFHTKPRMDEETRSHCHEPGAVIWGPLVLLAIPSVIAGAWFAGPMFAGFFGKALFVLPDHAVMTTLASEYHGPLSMGLHGFRSIPFYLAMAGVFVAWLVYVQFPMLSGAIRKIASPLYRVLVDKYGFDAFNQAVFAKGTRGLGWLFWRGGDEKLIDGFMVNGSANAVGFCSKVLRHLQSGYVYQYAFVMITGALALLLWLTLGK